MKIVLIQLDMVWQDIKANILLAQQAIEAARGADLYLLPEMWSTGFVTEPASCAEAPSQSRALAWMVSQARAINGAICGSLAIKEDGQFYNRFYFVKPCGEVESYDKRHLFTYGGEARKYTAGSRRVVVTYREVRFMLQVCYDLRFPIFSRNHKEYDVLLYVASWPHSRRAVWDLLLRARAVENQSYVLGVNRVGDDPLLHYSGGSVVVDAYGKVMAQCPDERPSTVAFRLDMEALRAFRTKFPVLDDADF